jgi:putative SOS response-associated peptidase YedK
METAQTAASYGGPWSRGQRCLVVAQGFFECQVQADGTKVPFYIHRIATAPPLNIRTLQY